MQIISTEQLSALVMLNQVPTKMKLWWMQADHQSQEIIEGLRKSWGQDQRQQEESWSPN